MTLLLLGIVLFFGTHALTMMRQTRADLIARVGAGPYKGLYSLGSMLGLVLMIWGFVQYRTAGYIPIWSPPRAMTHVAMALMLPAMILLMVYMLPSGRIKTSVQHPMLTMIKVWALAHLLVNGDLGSILLFGSFLAYAVIDRIALKRRADSARMIAIAWNQYDWMAIGAGIVAYLAVVYWLHPILFGVSVIAGR